MKKIASKNTTLEYRSYIAFAMRRFVFNCLLTSFLGYCILGCSSTETAAETVKDSLLLPDSADEFPVSKENAEITYPFSFKDEMSMVIPGGYYDKYQSEKYLKQKFYGLVFDSFTMKYSVEKINEAPDMLNSQDENGDIGYYWPLMFSASTKCLYLFSDNIINKPMPSVTNLIKEPLFLTDSQVYDYVGGDRKYRLKCMHSITKDGSLEYMTNYRLILKSTDKNGRDLKKSMLSFVPFFDDGRVEILFIGDLDGDTYPDLIIDNSHKYTGNGISMVFYSSKASKIKGMPVPVCRAEHGTFKSEFDENLGC